MDTTPIQVMPWQQQSFKTRILHICADPSVVPLASSIYLNSHWEILLFFFPLLAAGVRGLSSEGVVTIFHLSEGQYSSCDPPWSSDIHSHPLLELSVEKFWAFSGEKSKQHFQGPRCLLCLSKVLWGKQASKQTKKVRGKEEIRRWNCSNPPHSSTGQGSMKMELTPLPSKEFQNFPGSCCNHFADQCSLTFLNPSSNKIMMFIPFPSSSPKAQTNPCFQLNAGCKVPVGKKKKNNLNFILNTL